MNAPASPSEWDRFLATLGVGHWLELSRRAASLPRQTLDDGVSFRVSADPVYPQRPWALELLPWLITAASWARIEAGLTQRMRLLDGLMADIYGPQRLLHAQLIPPALVFGDPGYWRAAQGLQAFGATRLHVAAFDLIEDTRGDASGDASGHSYGNWQVLAQHLQAPAGLGYMLEHRACLASLFPEALRALAVRDVASAYDGLQRGVRPDALLTPGPFSDTYFDDAYLARHLGVALVHGAELAVRDECLYRATPGGPVPVHSLLRRLDDEFLDPLTLRADSRLGVPGLLQAVRAGNLMLANAPGAACLESAAWFGVLPGLAQALLGESLRMASVPTVASVPSGQTALWPLVRTWGGQLGDPSTRTGPQGMGTAGLVLRPAVLRVFVVSDGPQSWRVLPGGLGRVLNPSGASRATPLPASSESCTDVWVMGDTASMLGSTPHKQGPI